MILCIRMGLPTGPDDPTLDDQPLLRRLQGRAWCGRPLPVNEHAFATAGHAVHALWEMNGLSVCGECLDKVYSVLVRNAKKREP